MTTQDAATAHCTGQIDWRINSLVANNASKDVFSTYDNTTPEYVYSTTCALADVDLTAISVWNSVDLATIGWTLIAPQIILGAYHAVPAVGTTFRWAAADGTVYERTVTAFVRIGSTDIMLGKLSAVLPAAISPWPLLDYTYEQDVVLNGCTIATVLTNGNATYTGERKVVFGSLVRVRPFVPDDDYQITASDYGSWYELAVTGDSGFPWFLLLDGAPCLFSFYTQPVYNYCLAQHSTAIISQASAWSVTAPLLADFSTIRTQTSYNSMSQHGLSVYDVAAERPYLRYGLKPAQDLTVTARNMATLNRPAILAADGTDKTPVITEIYVAEIFVPANATVTGIAIFCGSGVQGDGVKVGLYTAAGVLVATNASGATGTASAGTDVYQRIPFTSAYAAKGPATYYVGVIYDGTTSRLNTHAGIGNGGASALTGHVYATAMSTTAVSGLTMPTTFTAGVGPIASLY